MKVKIPIGLLVLALVVAYLLGTESGRRRRDQLLVKLGRTEAEADAAIDLAEAALDEADAMAAANN